MKQIEERFVVSFDNRSAFTEADFMYISTASLGRLSKALEKNMPDQLTSETPSPSSDSSRNRALFLTGILVCFPVVLQLRRFCITEEEGYDTFSSDVLDRSTVIKASQVIHGHRPNM